MDKGIMQQLRQRYSLEMSLLLLERRDRELMGKCKEAKYFQRAQTEKQLQYQGSLRSFLDHLTGKREDKAEALSREVRQAEAALNALLREQEKLNQELTCVREGLSALPSLDALREAAAQEPDMEKEWAKLEAAFCAERLSPLLEENYHALLEYRSLMQGSRPEILSVEKQQKIYTEPNVWGEQCRPLLQRLNRALEVLGIPFSYGSYYSSPSSYLVTVAARHNRMDRVNQALDQVLAVQKQVSKVTQRLSGE